MSVPGSDAGGRRSTTYVPAPPVSNESYMTEPPPLFSNVPPPVPPPIRPPPLYAHHVEPVPERPPPTVPVELGGPEPSAPPPDLNPPSPTETYAPHPHSYAAPLQPPPPPEPSPPPPASSTSAYGTADVKQSVSENGKFNSAELCTNIVHLVLGSFMGLTFSLFSFLFNFCVPSLRGHPTRRNLFNIGCAIGVVAQIALIAMLAIIIKEAVKRFNSPA